MSMRMLKGNHSVKKKKESGFNKMKDAYMEYSIEIACGVLTASGINPSVMYKMLRK